MLTKIKFTFLTLFLLGCTASANAQCAMCRATLENNFSNGEAGIAAGINFGILYLLSFPYLIAGTLIYFWYKHSKNGKAKLTGLRSAV